jgi:hypothetical protein
MTALEAWLQEATRRLAKESAAQVRAEIADHYESSREASVAGGENPVVADRHALLSRGDPKAANRQYRRVLLTATEASILRMGSCEAALTHCRRRLKYSVIAVLIALFLVGRIMRADSVLFAAFVEMGGPDDRALACLFRNGTEDVVAVRRWCVAGGR